MILTWNFVIFQLEFVKFELGLVIFQPKCSHISLEFSYINISTEVWSYLNWNFVYNATTDYLVLCRRDSFDLTTTPLSWTPEPEKK